jgi:hypothetical protein
MRIPAQKHATRDTPTGTHIIQARVHTQHYGPLPAGRCPHMHRDSHTHRHGPNKHRPARQGQGTRPYNTKDDASQQPAPEQTTKTLAHTVRLLGCHCPTRCGRDTSSPPPSSTTYTAPSASHLALKRSLDRTGLRPRSHDSGTPGDDLCWRRRTPRHALRWTCQMSLLFGPSP